MERASAQCVAFRMPKQVYSFILKLSCTEVGIYNNANSPNGFLTRLLHSFVHQGPNVYCF